MKRNLATPKQNKTPGSGRLQRLVRSFAKTRETTSIPTANRLLKWGWILMDVVPTDGRFSCLLGKPTHATLALLDPKASREGFEKGSRLDRLSRFLPPVSSRRSSCAHLPPLHRRTV